MLSLVISVLVCLACLSCPHIHRVCTFSCSVRAKSTTRRGDSHLNRTIVLDCQTQTAHHLLGRLHRVQNLLNTQNPPLTRLRVYIHPCYIAL